MYYEDMDPVTDVYLWKDADYDTFQAEAGRYKSLCRAGGGWGDDLDFICSWNQEEYETAMNQGSSTFIVHGRYEPPDPGLGWWDDETYELWDAGRIQMKSGPEVTVHIRPDDLVAVYKPDPDMQILTLWIERDSPPDFSSLYLMDYDSLIQDNSPYEAESMDFTVEWDEQSYLDGLNSGADRFDIIGNYGIPDRPSPREQELFDRGLIRTEGHTGTVIRIADPDNQSYSNPYDSRFGYMWDYEYHIYIRQGTGYEAAVLPAAGSLTPLNDDPNLDREFALAWNREEYEAGIRSGKGSFTVSGAYTANPAWSGEDQDRWQKQQIRIEEGVPAPVLTVHILPDELPFQVALQNRGGLIPVFTFPWPNGAQRVAWMFSFDKETWYQGNIDWSPEWELKEVYDAAAAYDDEDELICIPADNPFPFYCKLAVSGSAFAGETAVMKVSPNEDGSWKMDEDQGGDHGGGGQGEHDRPGKEEPAVPPFVPILPPEEDKGPADTPETFPVPDFPDEEETPSGKPAHTDSPILSELPAETEQLVIVTGVPKRTSGRKTEQNASAAAVPERQSPSAEQQAQKDASDGKPADIAPQAPDQTADHNMDQTSPSAGGSIAEEPDGRKDPGTVRRYLPAAAATAAAALAGAGIARIYKRKKK